MNWTQALLLFGLSLGIVVAEKYLGETMPTGQLDGSYLEESKRKLMQSLALVGATAEGPSYTLERLISASYEFVAGQLFKYETELSDKDRNIKKCLVDLWSQSFVKHSVLVTFQCEGEEKVVRIHLQ